MELHGRVMVVTGGASGIGRALCERFAREGAAVVVVADRDGDGARAAARAISAEAEAASRAIAADAEVVDVADEAALRALVARVLERHGRIDLFCSNAGIGGQVGLGDSDEQWRRVLDVNVMAHVWAARAVLPSMLARGEGYLISTASAAGLLTQLGAAQYSVSKHAAVAFAEWLAIEYRDAGIRSSCLCPMGVRTGMLNETTGPSFLRAEMLEPEAVAEAVVEGLREERFLILPHPQVGDFVRHKAGDNERWLAGMRRLRRAVDPGEWEMGPSGE